MPAQRVQLPVEIFDEIFKHLHDDNWKVPFRTDCDAKPSLVACTLVCRGWRMLAQAHLFRNVYYSFMEVSDDDLYPAVEIPGCRWREYQDVNLCQPRKTLAMLHGFLTSSPRIASSIQRLVLDAHNLSTQAKRPLYTEVDGVYVSDLYDLLQDMPRLQDLCLRNVIVLPSSGFAKLSSARSSLRLLHIICDAVWNYATDISLVLSCFQRVDSLRLAYAFAALARVAASRTVDSKVSDVSMDIDENQICAFVRVLPQWLRYDTIRRLTVSGDPVRTYRPFINELGSNLEELTYQFPRHVLWEWDSDEVRAHFKGQSFPKLRILRISVPVHLTASRALCILLKRVSIFLTDSGISPATFPSLAELGLNVYFLADKDQPHIDTLTRTQSAKALDRTLLELAHQFSLQKIVIRWLLSAVPLPEDRVSWVSEIFPTLQENGMLDFCGVIGGVAPGMAPSPVFPFVGSEHDL